MRTPPRCQDKPHKTRTINAVTDTPTRKNLAPRASRRTARKNFTVLTLGIHVDAPRCYGVLLQNDSPAEIYQGRGPNPAAQIRNIIDSAKNPERIRIAYTNPENQHHSFLATPNITNYATLANTATPPTPYAATYAAIYNPKEQKHSTTPGLLITTPTATNDALQTELGAPAAQFIDPVVAYTQLEGLSLNIGNSAVTLTLTKNQQPRLHATLPIDGIHPLIQEFGVTPDGEPRLIRILKTRPDQQNYVDAQAAQATTTYLQTLTQHLAETLRYWAQQGHQIPREIFIHGPGGIARRLTQTLKTITLEPTTAPAFSALAQLDPDDRYQYITAYLAAKTYNTNEPHTQFPATKALQNQTINTTTKTHHQRRRNIKIAATTAALTLAVPLAAAGLEYLTANQRNTAATEKYAATLNVPPSALLNNTPITPVDAPTLEKLTNLPTGPPISVTQPAPDHLQIVIPTDQVAATLDEIGALGKIHHTLYEPATGHLTVVLEIADLNS